MRMRLFALVSLGPGFQGIEDTLSHCPSKSQSLTLGQQQSRVWGALLY